MTGIDMADELVWKRSTYSDSQGGACVEVAHLAHRTGVRDSKDKQLPALYVPHAAWQEFVRHTVAIFNDPR
ncbi:DUF397 domain-containing protein [Streptomyces sp. NPDC127068]|uniref:DUF397 domain-containing protein n=1 Tax=Streptomyces sp. NPDC127068 TaxID=3347127 RepID=UPI00365F956D